VSPIAPSPSPSRPQNRPKTSLSRACARGLPRRRVVPRHPGIYYRPGPCGKVQPPYEIRYLDSSGVRRWALVHGDLAEAEAKRAELRLRRRGGQHTQPTRQTFEPYARAWLARQQCRPRTLEILTWALERHLIPSFGRRRLDQITVDDIAAYISVMRGKGLRGSTINTTLRPLSRILAHAARRGHIPINPLTQLERGERPRLDDQRPKRILTLEEMQALLEAADGERYRCLLELLLTAGLRIGEALGLTAADLDAQHSIITVQCQLGRDGTRTPLKTEESRRALDIPPQLMRRLHRLLADRGVLFDPSAYVFASRSGNGLERKVARAALQRACKAARIPDPQPSLHDLRHSHASMLIALDHSVADVQRRLGHRKPDTTLRIYTHQWKYRDARRSQIGQQLEHLFEQPRQLTSSVPPPAPAPMALPAAAGA
jgi:integrase